MDFGAVYDQLGDGVTVGSLLETAAVFPIELRDHLETVFADNTPEDVVERGVFIDIMSRVPSIKMTRLATLFDDMSLDGYITSESLDHIFGVNAGLMVPDKTMVYDFDEFVDNFGDLFDNNGDVRELPSTMIEQLKAIHNRIEALDGDVGFAQMERIAAEERIGTERQRHAAERDEFFEEAARVEEDRNSLYDELKVVRKQLAEQRRSAARPLTPEEVEPRKASAQAPLPAGFDDFDAAVAALSPGDDGDAASASDDDGVKYAAIATEDDLDAASAPEDDGDAESVLYHQVFDTEDPAPPLVKPYDGASAWASAEVPVTNHCWFRDMNRPGVEAFLDGTPVGTFVVRHSSRGEGYAMSIRKLHGVLHYLILEVDKGYALHFVDGTTTEMVEPVCATVATLVDYLRTTPINAQTPLLIDPEFDK